jgi:hypothetical protein
MEFKEIIQKAENTDEFKEFKKHHEEAYLVHIFKMSGVNPQVGYFSKKTKKITTFELGDSININEEAPFQEQEHDIKELNIEKIKLDYDDALTKANEVKKESYEHELVNKEIIVIQHLQEECQVYNITFITQAFKTLNIKINAETGEVISHNLANLVGL